MSFDRSASLDQFLDADSQALLETTLPFFAAPENARDTRVRNAIA